MNGGGERRSGWKLMVCVCRRVPGRLLKLLETIILHVGSLPETTSTAPVTRTTAMPWTTATVRVRVGWIISRRRVRGILRLRGIEDGSRDRFKFGNAPLPFVKESMSEEK